MYLVLTRGNEKIYDLFVEATTIDHKQHMEQFVFDVKYPGGRTRHIMSSVPFAKWIGMRYCPQNYGGKASLVAGTEKMVQVEYIDA